MTEKTKKGRKIKDLWNRLVKGRKPPLEEQLRKQQINEIRSLLSIGKTEKVADKLKEDPQNISLVVELLSHEKAGVRRNATGALKETAKKGVDISGAVPALGKALDDKDSGVREGAALALGKVALNGADISAAVGALGKALEDEEPGVRRRASRALVNAAWPFGSIGNAVDISAAIPLLGKALEDEDSDVRVNAAWALWTAASIGMDISAAIPLLGKALEDEDSDVRKRAAWALGHATANEKTREAAVRKILEFTNSSWFMREAEKNSDAFIRTVNGLDRALRKAKEEERKVA